MIETITRKVAPREENETADIMRCFGWRLKSTQEVNSKESHLERQGDTLYSVTTSENYVKLFFERDTSMPNYSKLASLEREYCSILRKKPLFPKVKFWGFAALGLFAALVLNVVLVLFGSRLPLILLIAMTAVLPAITFHKYKKQMTNYHAYCNKEFKRIFSSAKSLL